MALKTHILANSQLVGSPIEIREGVEARAKLRATPEMAVDNEGLVHGGFAFGLADYAAMIAVNHPFVVLAGSNVRFLAPVKVGDEMLAEAAVKKKEDKRRIVQVEVSVEGSVVLRGEFVCVLLNHHVLSKSNDCK